MNDTEILKKVQELDLIENENWIAISANTGKNIEKLKTLIKQNFDSTTKINSED
jgi:50S ribosomal subunit-associated GTPase HflX